MVSINSGSFNKNQQQLAFGRAFTTAERKFYEQKMDEILGSKEKGIVGLYQINDPNNNNQPVASNNHALILPDFYVQGKTLNSKEALDLILLNKTLNRINTVQCLPRGPVKEIFNNSPFSSSPFEIGEHLIELNLLGTNSLEKSFDNFKTLPADSALKVKYNEFNEKYPYLQNYGMYEALSKKHGTDNYKEWSKLDQEVVIYDGYKKPSEEVVARRTELMGDKKFSNDVEFYKYGQFIAKGQHQERKKELNDNGIKLFGDCLIGFSDKDMAIFRPAFEEGKTLGAAGDDITAKTKEELESKIAQKQIENPSNQYKIMEKGPDDENYRAMVFDNWGSPCLDFKKLGTPDNLGPAGKLLKQKFDVFLDNYDGARIDAGWQLSNPCSSINNHITRSNNPGQQPEVIGSQMLDILEKSISEQANKGHHIEKEDINIETLGGPTEAVQLIKTKGYPQIHHSQYEKDDWGRLGFYNSSRNSNDHEKNNTGYKLTDITFGPSGCHDDRTLYDLSTTKEDRENQAKWLAPDLKINADDIKDDPEAFRNAKCAESYMARNRFITATDAIGDGENGRRLNNPKASTPEEKKQNWSINISDLAFKQYESPEEIYHRNLSEGKGLNTPKSLAMAIRAKMGENDRTREALAFLDKAGEILREKGPNTTAEADAHALDGKLGDTLVEIGSSKQPSGTTSNTDSGDTKFVTLPSLKLHGGFGTKWEMPDILRKTLNKSGFKVTNDPNGGTDIQMAIPVPNGYKGTFSYGVVRNGQFDDESKGTVSI